MRQLEIWIFKFKFNVNTKYSFIFMWQQCCVLKEDFDLSVHIEILTGDYGAGHSFLNNMG